MLEALSRAHSPAALTSQRPGPRLCALTTPVAADPRGQRAHASAHSPLPVTHESRRTKVILPELPGSVAGGVGPLHRGQEKTPG